MKQILFVYNADSTFAASIKDFIIKLIAPRRYACNLCMVTYGVLRMKREWKDFIAALPQTVEFLHRDEFRDRYRDDAPLPAVFGLEANKPRLLIGAEEINQLHTLSELKELVKTRVGQHEA